MLTYDTSMKKPDPSPEAENECRAERQQYPAERECWQFLPVNGWKHRIPHPLSSIGEWVEQAAPADSVL
jgi:hypothetical protein